MCSQQLARDVGAIIADAGQQWRQRGADGFDRVGGRFKIAGMLPAAGLTPATALRSRNREPLP